MSRPSSRPRPIRLAALAPLALVALVLGGTLGACAAADRMTPPGADPVTVAASPAAIPEAPVVADVPAGTMVRPTQAEFDAAWATRPAYVADLPAEWQSAYAYALARPDVLQWLPCYCGCGGMGHRSNLDCFFERREASLAWEKHASFCDICVETANLAARMLSEGSTIGEIRQAVDATFGGGAAPGTDTALPPA